MSNASFVRTNFLGGEWSQEAQGRMDRDDYLTAMNLSFNGMATDTGAWVRRSGSLNVGPTRRGTAAKIHELHFNQQSSYVAQFDGNGHLRFTTDGFPVFDEAAANTISSAAGDPVSVTTGTAHGWSTGDSVIISFDGATVPNPDVALLTGRMYRITVTGASTFTLQDERTNDNIDGAALSGSTASLRVRRVLDFVTPYGAQYATLTMTQNQNVAFVLSSTVRPYAIDMNWDGSGITFGAADFEDGPYLDAVEDVATITPSGTTGTVTLTSNVNIWSATDVGRMMRILDEPDIWDAGTSYVVGNNVEYPTASGAFWVALKSSLNVPPDTDLTSWGTLARGRRWTWGTIASFVDPQEITFTIRGPDFPHALPKYTYRLGLYSDTTGWPSVGAFHQGRFWLSGVQPNRIDASAPSVTNSNTISFAPTNIYGQVADNNGISAGLKAKDVAGVQWLMPSDRGLIVGTRGGEWLLQASTQNDPMTPTNLVANRVTKYKSARGVQAIEAPLATIFVQSHGRGLIEYVPDGTEGGKFGGRDLAHDAKHLTAFGLTKLAYQQEPTPLIWGLSGDGTLRSISYLRDSPWSSQEPTYAGWSQHAWSLVQNRSTFDLVSGPSPDGTADAVTLVTYKADAAVPASSYAVEVFHPMFEEGSTGASARFLDHSRTPTLGEAILTGGSITAVRLHGLWYLENTTVTIFFGGVNAGEFEVINGRVDVPVSDDSLVNETFLQEFATTATTPAAAGYGSSLILGVGTGGAAAVTMNEVWQLMAEANASQVAESDWLVDWTNMQAIWQADASNEIQFSSLVDGSSLALSGQAGNSGWTVTGKCLDDTNFYACYQGSGNTSRVSVRNLTTWASVGDFWISDSGSINFGISAGATRDSVTNDRTLLLSSSGNVSGTNMRVFGINITTGVSLGEIHNPSNDGVVKFSSHRTPGVLYGLNGRTSGRGATQDMYLYEYTIASGVSVNLLASYTPSQFDAAATSWSEFDGPVLDETDGNLIAYINTGVGEHLVKLSTTDGSVIWDIPASFVGWGRSDRSGLHQSVRIQNGQLVGLSGRTSGNNQTRQVVDTIAGTSSTSTVAGFFPVSQCYNDTTGHLIARTEYVPTSPAPQPAGPYTVNGWGTSTRRIAFLGPVAPPASDLIIPILAGYPFTSKGQVTAPIASEETGARNGPRFGKTARIHQAAYRVNKTQDLQWGTSFNELQEIQFRLPGGALYTDLQLFSGTYQDTINDNPNIDASQLCWQSDGPFPATILAVGGFIQTNDR